MGRPANTRASCAAGSRALGCTAAPMARFRCAAPRRRRSIARPAISVTLQRRPQVTQLVGARARRAGSTATTLRVSFGAYRRRGRGRPRATLRIHIIQPRGLDEHGRERRPLGAAYQSGEQPQFPAERDRPFILPALGPKSRFIMAGMRCAEASSWRSSGMTMVHANRNCERLIF